MGLVCNDAKGSFHINNPIQERNSEVNFYAQKYSIGQCNALYNGHTYSHGKYEPIMKSNRLYWLYGKQRILDSNNKFAPNKHIRKYVVLI